MNQITKEHILQAIQEIDKEGSRPGRHSSTYDLSYNDKLYPPKLVISIANRFATGIELKPEEFQGGPNKPAFDTLEKYGFKIVPKKDKITELISSYKEHIKVTQLQDEKYKWELLYKYKGRPNLDAVDFLQELKSINYSNLIYAMGKAVIFHLATEKPIELKEMFRKLFDESISLNQRIKTFNAETLSLYRSLGQKLQHHQDERTISTYLTFNNPEKYTFYKSSFYKKLCQLLNVKPASKNEKYIHYLELVNQIIKDYIIEDTDLINLVKQYVTEYDGSNHLLLVQDIIYQMLDKQSNENDEDLSNETRLISILREIGFEDSVKFYSLMENILNELKVKKGDTRICYSLPKNKLIGLTIGQKYCTIIVRKQKANLFSYFDTINNEKNWLKEASSIQEMIGKFRTIIDSANKELLVTVKTGYSDHSSPILEKSLFEKEYKKHIFKEAFKREINTQIMSTSLNQILYGPPGTGKTYHTVLEAAKIVTGNESISYDEALKVFNDNLHNQIEFITFHQNYSYEDFIQGLRPDTENGSALTFEKKDGVFKRIADRALKNLEAANKAPEELSNETMFDKALELFKDNILDTEDKYRINDAVYIFEVDDEAFRYTGSNWEKHANGIRMKFADLKEFYRNSVKTRRDIKALKTISGLANQHATYYLLVYEAILKFLPTKLDYKVEVEVDKKNYVIIIDEINRANISRVFGELITLIEEDKRSGGKIPLRVTLPSGDSFTVPSNLYIIGTMNTADKSISLLDIALRRRFEFVPMYPNTLIEGVNSPSVLETINAEIIKRKGHDFTIGHAYFMGDNYTLEKTINNKVIPLLLEYFMNDVKEVTTILKAADIEVMGWPMKMKTA
jgi:5-methylcytosine-specific restriction protein B